MLSSGREYAVRKIVDEYGRKSKIISNKGDILE